MDNPEKLATQVTKDE